MDTKKEEGEGEGEGEEEGEEEGEKTDFGSLATFWCNTFAMVFHNTGVFLARKTLEDGFIMLPIFFGISI